MSFIVNSGRVLYLQKPQEGLLSSVLTDADVSVIWSLDIADPGGGVAFVDYVGLAAVDGYNACDTVGAWIGSVIAEYQGEVLFEYKGLSDPEEFYGALVLDDWNSLFFGSYTGDEDASGEGAAAVDETQGQADVDESLGLSDADSVNSEVGDDDYIGDEDSGYTGEGEPD